MEGSIREEGSASQGHKGSVVGGWPMGSQGHLELTECVGEERDPVTEVHTDGEPDVMSPDHPLGLQFHRFSLGYTSGTFTEPPGH